MKMIYTPSGIAELTEEEITKHPFTDANGKALFYSFLYDQFAGGLDRIESIDCRKFCIAQNIQNSWYRYAENLPDEVESVDTTSLTMALAMCGPKVNKDLPDNTIEFEPGWLTPKTVDTTE